VSSGGADNSTKAPRVDWIAAPVIIVPRVSCPFCGAEGYDKTRTLNGGDGSLTKLCTCRGCGAHYKICEETPDSGLEVIWPVRMTP